MRRERAITPPPTSLPRWVAGIAVSIIAAAGAPAAAQVAPLTEDADKIRLRGAVIETGKDSPGADVATAIRSAETRAPGTRYLLRLDGPLTPSRRAALESAGVTLGAFIDTNAYTAAFNGANPAKVADLGFVDWVGPYDPAWKLHPRIGRRALTTDARAADAAAGLVSVVVHLFPDSRRNELGKLTEEIDRVGGEIVHHGSTGDTPVLVVRIGDADLGILAESHAVRYVEELPELTLRTTDARWVIQSNVQSSTPLYANGLTGLGQVIGVIDSVVDELHCSFDDTEPPGPGHRKLVAYNVPTSSPPDLHGTRVAGVAAGDPGFDADTRGMAFEAKIAYNDIPRFAAGDIYERLMLHHEQGAAVHTNSWGDDFTTDYNGLTYSMDMFMHDNEYDLVLVAATNGSFLKNPENAKNIISCGASSNWPAQANACFGGQGPTADGRRKPELYAPGCGMSMSAAYTTCSTNSDVGTSYAAPLIAGAAAMARQYFMDGYYPTGAPVPADARTPTGALLKAVLINSGTDMSPAGYPSDKEGWGRLLADDALYFTGDDRGLIVEDRTNTAGLLTGGVIEREIAVLTADEELRVTLAWTDVPGAIESPSPAVNNLDLEVVAPDGTTYLGNWFSGGASAAGGTPDQINNLEQVHVPAPTPGFWTVRVRATAVNAERQGYALVTTGDVFPGFDPPTVLAFDVPTMLAPGVETTFDVTIDPGADTITAASLRYRTDDGPYLTAALTPIGGDQYTAAIPPMACGDIVEYYVEALGTTIGDATAPTIAPQTVFAATVGTIGPEMLVFEEDFESGTLPAGWTASGLWSITTQCGPADPCDGASWAYFGSPQVCNYAGTGGQQVGSLVLQSLALPAVDDGGAITLEFCSAVDVQDSLRRDLTQVRVDGAIIDEPPITMGPSGTQWEQRTVDLTPFAGQTVDLEWHFDTVNGFSNSFTGWFVDAVRITVEPVECIESCPGDANGDGAVNGADLSVLIGDFGNAVPPGTGADFNGDGVVNGADLSVLIAAFGTDC